MKPSLEKTGQPRFSLRTRGIAAALASAGFLGLAPVFGKQAINLGIPALAVVSLRTFFATLLVFLVIIISNRKFLYIYPAGLFGCFLAGGINGIGSLFYYGALARIPANLGQLLYSLYPLFVLFWLWFDHQPPSKLTLMRLLLVLPGVFLLTWQFTAEFGKIDWIGIFMMLCAASLYALHLPINQRVLYDMPAPTVTLYTLAAMSLVVVPSYMIAVFLFHTQNIFEGTHFQTLFNFSNAISTGVIPLAGLTVVTFLSRLTLFLGVKHLGGLQAALLGLGELLVTLIFSRILLGEYLSAMQWIGAILIFGNLFLVAFERTASGNRFRGGWLSWLRPPGLSNDFPWPGD